MSTSTEEDPDTMPDGELLALPGGAIPPGWLTEFFARRSALVHQRDFDELNLELSGDSGRRSMLFPGQDPNERRRREEEVAYEESMRDIRQRSDRLLAQIEVRQQEIEKQRQEIEDRAIQLHDGRRVFVDGDSYRDEQGRVLTGDDAREAVNARLSHPNASTWQERQKIQEQSDEAERLRQDVLREQQEGARGGAGLSADDLAKQRRDAEQRMTGYEKEFSDKIAATQAMIETKPDPASVYGAVSLDDYGGPSGGAGKTSVPDFTRAVAGVPVSQPTPDALVPSAQGTPKVQT